MARSMTGDKMIASVRLRTMAPDDVSVFDDDDILNIIDEEMQVQVLDKLVELHGENLTISVDIPRNSEGVYEIPYRALGNKLRDVSLVSGNQIYELSQISIGELPDYSYNSAYSPEMIDLFYVEGNEIKLVKPARSYDTVRMRYYLRPSYLTKLERAGVISSVTKDEVAGTVTLALSQVGRTFSVNENYDIVSKKTPNKIRTFDLTPTNLVNSNGTGSITFALSDVEDIFDKIQTGDYVTLAEETPVPNIPTEMFPLLAQASAVHILESMTDSEALRNASARLDKISASVQQIIDYRVELAPKKIKPRHGTLNQNYKRYRGRGGY